MTTEKDNIINSLLEEKERILKKRRETAKNDIEALKEINKVYMRIYMKIQYHTDENKRLNKCLSATTYNNTHKSKYREYQKTYYKEHQPRNNIISVS